VRTAVGIDGIDAEVGTGVLGAARRLARLGVSLRDAKE
jgi:hypothetical protein